MKNERHGDHADRHLTTVETEPGRERDLSKAGYEEEELIMNETLAPHGDAVDPGGFNAASQETAPGEVNRPAGTEPMAEKDGEARRPHSPGKQAPRSLV